jgi:hypothetical protein
MDKRSICLSCLGLVLGLVPPNTAVAADPSLVGWWKLDETVGTVAVDSSLSGNHGTVQGTPQWVNGQVDGALYLDGAGTYVELPIGPLIKSLTNGTIGVWAYWTGSTTDSDWQRIFEFGSSGASYMFLSPSANSGGPMRFVIRSSWGGTEEVITATAALGNGWHHVVVTIDSDNSTIALYLDGTKAVSGAMVANKLSYMGTTFYNWIGRGQHDTPSFKGYLDDFCIFSRVLAPQEIVALEAGGGLGRGLASRPAPADREADVRRNTVLQWTAGCSANTHNVYLGDSFEAIESADTGSPLLVSSGQSATTYDPGCLEFGRTYYWRVDEVNAPPDKTVFRGDVWSFTVEPYAYPISAASVTATASSSMSGRGPEKTIDGSGLNPMDGHSTVLTDMWQTAKGTSLPAWIQYEFDKPYQLNKMLVWNYNGESFLAIQGAKEVIVEYSLDGATWTPLAGVSEFPMASGTAGHPSDITVDFGNVAAQYVKITVKSNYAAGLYSQCGLSEVRLLAVPVTARNPRPAPDANNADPRSLLTWRPGREADHHRVYVGQQEAAVRAGTAPVHTTTEGQIAGAQLDLQLGQKYYWRVDEVNDTRVPAVWPGAIWAFTTAPYLAVDDFESYGNTLSDQPFQTWIDGVGFILPEPGNPGNNTGAVVGHDIWSAGSGYYNGFIMETAIAHGGQQALPLYYDNSGAGGLQKYSQTDRTFVPAQDWTQFGITTLVLHFYGSPGNTGQLYVKIGNLKIPYPGNAADLATEAWTPWEIDLTFRAAAVRAVSTLSIGVDGSGAGGMLYIDDIRLK